MYSTVSGMTILVRARSTSHRSSFSDTPRLTNALTPIRFTITPSISRGITTSPPGPTYSSMVPPLASNVKSSAGLGTRLSGMARKFDVSPSRSRGAYQGMSIALPRAAISSSLASFAKRKPSTGIPSKAPGSASTPAGITNVVMPLPEKALAPMRSNESGKVMATREAQF